MPGAHVSRVGFPRSLDEWEANLNDESLCDLEHLLTSREIVWSTPAWAQVGDVVFFQMTLRGARDWKRVRERLSDPEQLIDDGEGGTVYPYWFIRLRAAFFRFNIVTTRLVGGEVPSFAGCLFAVGRVGAQPESLEVSPDTHFRSRTFAHIAEITPLAHPVRVVRPSTLSRHGVYMGPGPLVHRSFQAPAALAETLEAVRQNNELPHFLQEMSLEERRAANSENWMEQARTSGGGYPTEAHLRASFVNFLLRAISDRARIYSEVEVVKDGRRTGVVDDLVLIDGTLVPVEVKLNSKATPNVLTQVARYSGPAQYRQGKRTIGIAEHPVALLIDYAGLYLVRGGEFVDCDLDNPLLPRSEVTVTSVADSLRRIRSALSNN